MRITKLNRVTWIVFVIVLAAGVVFGFLRKEAFERSGQQDIYGAGRHTHEQHRH